MPRDDATLLDLAQASRRIARFLEGLTEPRFLEDEKS